MGVYQMKPLNFFKSPNVLVALLSLQVAGVAYGAQRDDERARFHEAMQSCAESLNLPAPQAGAKPPQLSDETKAAMDNCLERQGVSLPPMPPPRLNENFRKRMDACLANLGVAPPKFLPGSAPPALSDDQKSALDQCRAQVESSSIQ